MKLDKRIEKLSDILACTNIEEAKQYIEQKGYFVDNITLFDNLSDRNYATLTEVRDSDSPFRGQTVYWRYFIPECKLKPKEKKYRPYTIEEFCNEGFEIIVFRDKDDPSLEYHFRYNGYRKSDTVYRVILGNISYALKDLFTDYEYLDEDGNWKPFGVEE